MMFDFLPFFVRIVIFVIVVRIIAGAVSEHNRRTRVHAGCCQTATFHGAPVVKPVQASVAAPVVAPVTEVRQEVIVPAAPVGEARFCSSCGAQRAPNARFCTTCGIELA